MTPYEAAVIFAAFESADDYESLMWRVDTRPGTDRAMKLFAICSDVFFWATADAEEITDDDVPLLEQCLADLAQAGAAYYLAELFAARKRKLRPQEPFYRDMPEDVAVLFDACCTGEERAEADRQDAGFWIHVARTAAKDPAPAGTEGAT